MKSKSIFAILGVALAMLISFSITDLQADCGDPGWQQMPAVDVGRIEPCFTIQVVYCFYKHQAGPPISAFDIEFSIAHVFLIPDSDTCDFRAAQEEFNNNYGYYIDIIAKGVLKDLVNKGRIDPALCDEEQQQISYQLTMAACQTNDLVLVDQIDTGEWLIPISEFVPCSDEAKCLSIYKTCFYNDPDTGLLEARQELVERRTDITNACPDQIWIEMPVVWENPLELNPEGYYHECGVKCD